MQVQSRAHALGGGFDGCEEGFHKATRLGLTQFHRIMAADDFFRRSTHMRNHEHSDGTAFQSSRTLQQSLVIRCNSGDEAIRAAGSGDGRHGFCVPKCATLCARRKSGFSFASCQKIAIAVVVQLLRAVHQLVGLARFGRRRECFAANAGDFLVKVSTARAEDAVLTGSGNGLTRFQMRFRHRMHQVWVVQCRIVGPHHSMRLRRTKKWLRHPVVRHTEGKREKV